MNYNRAIIAGRLTRDPELKMLPSGNPVTSFSLATSRVSKDAAGQRQEDAEFHNIVVFGKQANPCADFLKKGAVAMVEGRLQTRSWESNGVRQYRTEIIADRVEFGPRTRTDEAAPAPRQETPAAPATSLPKYEYPVEDINPEDIPF